MKLKNMGLIIFVLFLLTSCASSQSQEEVTNFTVESMALLIGYEMRDSFEWTEQTEQYYQAILAGNLSLDGAQVAAKYLRETIHPVLADRMIRLAIMSGFDIDSLGNVIGISNVKLPLLQSAAQGFKMGLHLED